MAKLVPVGYVDFVLNILREGDPEPYAVTFGGQIDAGPFTTGNALDVGLRWGVMAPVMQGEDTIVGITAYVANDGPPFIYEEPLEIEGTDTGSPLPQNCAVIVTKSTGLGGRWNKGRFFWPSVDETLVGFNGELSVTYRGQIQGIVNTLLSDLTDPLGSTNLSNLVVFHDESLNIPPTPITSLQVEPVIGTQRRRLRR